MLIDATSGLTDLDKECLKMAAKMGVSYNVVMTKIDKTNSNDDLELVKRELTSFMSSLLFFSPYVVMTSAKCVFK